MKLFAVGGLELDKNGDLSFDVDTTSLYVAPSREAVYETLKTQREKQIASQTLHPGQRWEEMPSMSQMKIEEIDMSSPKSISAFCSGDHL